MNIVKNIAVICLIFTFFTAPLCVNALNDLEKGIKDGLDDSEYNKNSNDTVSNILIKVIKWFLRILAILAVLVLIIAGIMYILSGGDEGKVETAKKWIIYAIIGLIVALLAWVIVNLITDLTGTASK